MLETPTKKYFNYAVEESVKDKPDDMIVLRDLIDRKNLSMDVFFRISIGLCDLLKIYDLNNIVNVSINPSCIYVDLKTGNIVINENIEEQQCNSIKVETSDYAKHYASPEILGVINREVDQRSNLYSIGMIIYEMLTCKLPRELYNIPDILLNNKENNTNYIDLTNKEIPVQLSNIIMKLLAENPDQRYKSSWGLKFDLERCYIYWRSHGNIKKFKLGAKDISSKLEIHNKLYGRQKEKNRVLNAYKRIANGEAELLMILSENGMGRSWFINECLRSISSSGGSYIWYQVNDNNMTAPYSTVITLLNHLINKVMIDKDADIELIKSELKEILGENTKAILELVPKFKYLINSDNNFKKINTNESECIFNMLFHKIVAVFCRSNKPLVIFIDDIHNLHSSCLNLIVNLATNYEIKYLMIILGTKYDETNLVGYKNFHGDFFDYIKKTNVRVTEIRLKPLKINDIIELVSDTFKCTNEKALPLATVLQSKTYGNYLYIEQLIKSFIEKRYVTFNYEKFEWTWDMEQIGNENALNTVVEVLIEKMTKLPSNTMQLMILLAYLKSEIKLETLAYLSGTSIHNTYIDLKPAIQNDFIQVLNSEKNKLKKSELKEDFIIKFSHECVKEAILSMRSTEDMRYTNLKIATRLLTNCSSQAFKDHMNDITNNFNHAVPLIVDNRLKIKIVALNLLSGKNSYEVNNFEQAIKYYNNALDLVKQNKLSKCSRLLWLINIEKIKCEMNRNNLEIVELLLANIEINGKSKLEKLEVYNMKIRLLLKKGDKNSVVKYALEALAYEGIDFPEKIESSFIEEERRSLLESLPEDFENKIRMLPDLKDKRIYLILQIFEAVSEAVVDINNNQFIYCIINIVKLSLKYGNSGVSALGYCILGLLTGNNGDIQTGYSLGKMSIEINSKYNNLSISIKVNLIYGFHICHWREDYDRCIFYLDKAIENCINTGDVSNLNKAIIYKVFIKFVKGSNINEIRQDLNKYYEFTNNCPSILIQNINNVLEVLINLFNISRKLNVDLLFVDFEKLESIVLETGNITILGIFNIIEIRILCAKGNYKKAIENIKKNLEILEPKCGSIIYIYCVYYSSLVLSLCFKLMDRDEKIEIKALLSKYNNVMDYFGKYNEANYLSKKILVNAELNNILGNKWESQEMYKLAAEQAEKNKLYLDLIDILIFTSRFYSENGLKINSKAYIDKAREVCESLNEELVLYPIINESFIESNELNNIDTNSAIKVSKIISEEIVEEKLYPKLMNMTMEVAGAQRGFLILTEEDKVIVKLEGKTYGAKKIILREDLLEEVMLIAKSVVNYTIESKKPVIINDVINEPLFFNDQYIVNYKPKSILSIPLIYKDKILGVFYFENNIASNFFTGSKLQLLKFICNQAAIAMENASMFKKINELKDELEGKVKKRTDAIEKIIDNLEMEIFERIKIENSLRESEERYKLLIDVLPVGLCIRNENGILFANKVYSEILGFSNPEELIGKQIEELLEPDHEYLLKIAEEKELVENKGKVINHTQKLIRSIDGKEMELETSKVSFPYDYEKAILVIIKDVTEQKSAERLNREIEEMNKRLHEELEYDKLKTEFFSNISHELRTPLNVILTSNQMINYITNENDLEKIKKSIFKYTNLTKQNCYRLIRLTNNLLDITKIDSGFINISLINCNIVSIIEDITLSVVEYAKRKEIDIIFDTDVEEKIIACDVDKIERIILNLLSNAIKFTEKGGIIEVILKDRNDIFEIRVKDSGIGIPEEKLYTIFERFVQVDKSLSRNYEGSGIGLSLVKSLVEMHGGRINIKSTYGKGSEFIIEIPQKIIEEEVTLNVNNKYDNKVDRINIEFSDIYF